MSTSREREEQHAPQRRAPTSTGKGAGWHRSLTQSGTRRSLELIDDRCDGEEGDRSMHTEALADALIARFDGVVDRTKLQKLMYYANAWHLAIVGEPLVRLPFRAWTFGPVMEPIWRTRQDEETRDSRHRTAPRLEPFTERLLDMVVEEYGHRGSVELSEMTHAEAPWLQARADTPADEPSRRIIDSQVIAEHYRGMHELCGYRASELAVLGLPDGDDDQELPPTIAEPVVISDLPEDEWGGANLFVVPGAQAR